MELIALAVLRGVVQLHRLRLERDAALALDRIVVENLRVHFTLFQSTGQLDETIGERRLAVVDMRDDAEIADVILTHGAVVFWGLFCKSAPEQGAGHNKKVNQVAQYRDRKSTRLNSSH